MAVADDDAVQIILTLEELRMACGALDSHEYWQLGDVLPRNNGYVFLPGDLAGENDYLWDGREPTDEEQAAIDDVRSCRARATRLSALVRDPR